MLPDCECVATTAPPSFSTSSARSIGVQVFAGASSFGSQTAQTEPGSVDSAVPLATGHQFSKEGHTSGVQVNVARFAVLRLSHVYALILFAEILNHHGCQFAIATAGKQGTLHKLGKVFVTGRHQCCNLNKRTEANLWHIDALERLHIDPCSIADDPLSCVALGTGRVLENAKIMRHVLTTAF